MPSIDIYTQPFCPYCARALNLFSRRGIAVNEIDAPQGTRQRQEAIERSGGRTTVPQIFINGQHIGGSDDLLALERTGKLDVLLTA